MQKILLSLVIAGFTANAFAGPKGTAVIGGLPASIPRDSTLTVRTIALSDASHLSTKRLKKSSTFIYQTLSVPSVVSVTYFGRSNGTIRTGFSRTVGSFVKSRAALEKLLRIKLKKTITSKRLSLSDRPINASSSYLRVGIPLDGIIVTGTGTESWMPKAQVQLLLTELIAASPCYYKNDGFVLIDLDPEVAIARQREFDLCATGRADPLSCVSDGYQAPTILIKGNLQVSGDQATLTLRQTNQAGSSIFETTVLGSIKDIASWEILTRAASKNLTANLCSTSSLEVTKASCETPSCTQPCGNGAAFRQLPTITGTAKGPVGSIVNVGFSKSFATIDCGEWSPESCDANVCCKRTTEDQPAAVSFSAVLDLFQGLCLCPSGNVTTYDTITQIQNSSPLEVNSLIECPT